MTTSTNDVYFDPYDVGITPTRTRCSAGSARTPLYYNDEHDFYALSRFDDVEPAWSTPGPTSRGAGRSSSSSRRASRCRPASSSSRTPRSTPSTALLSRVFTPRR